jgi:hypothetical protein
MGFPGTLAGKIHSKEGIDPDGDIGYPLITGPWEKKMQNVHSFLRRFFGYNLIESKSIWGILDRN